MKYGMIFILAMATTSHAATIATTSGTDLTWIGPNDPGDGPHTYQLDVVFSPDFTAADATLTAPTTPYDGSSWQLTWPGMDEASRRFYASAANDFQITLTGSDFSQLADETFEALIQTVGFSYWPSEYNGGNFTTRLTAEAVPTVSVVPEPAGVLLLFLGLALTGCRKATRLLCK
jgi:hypothetical protein